VARECNNNKIIFGDCLQFFERLLDSVACSVFIDQQDIRKRLVNRLASRRASMLLWD
jgi:hypothetical protein